MLTGEAGRAALDTSWTAAAARALRVWCPDLEVAEVDDRAAAEVYLADSHGVLIDQPFPLSIQPRLSGDPGLDVLWRIHDAPADLVRALGRYLLSLQATSAARFALVEFDGVEALAYVTAIDDDTVDPLTLGTLLDGQLPFVVDVFERCEAAAERLALP